jgi:outer membrane protein OmpA-like peptidoglycan-associated protein
MQRVSPLMMFGAVVTYLLFSAMPASAQNARISGYVKDSKNKAIPRINVMILRGIANIASAETDDKGNYTINYPTGRAVTVLFNGNTVWNPLKYDNVLGDLTLNVQLTNRSEKLSRAEAKSTMEALDFLAQVPELVRERQEYAKLIDASLFPPEFQQKIFQDNVLARLNATEDELSSTVTKTSEIEENSKRISGQLDELAAVSNAARGGAKAAQATADAAIAGVNATNERISAIDEYSIISDLSASVEFTGSSVTLTTQATKILDQLALKIVAAKGYTLTISGFADAKQSGLAAIRISQLRAEAVARYLTANYEIPLWRVNAILGYGASQTIGGKKPGGPANRVDVTTLINRGLNAPAPTMTPEP